MYDDDWPDRIEYDPRWEVQPETDDEDEPGNRVRAVLTAFVAMTVFAVLLVWLVTKVSPAL
jgi:hypothetical protein